LQRLCGEEAVEHGPDVRLGQLLAYQVARRIALAGEPDQGALVMEADDLYLVTELVTIQSACGGQDDAVPAAAVQLMGQAAAGTAGFLELEEVAAHGEGSAGAINQREGDEAFGGQEALGLNLDVGEQRAKLGQELGRRRIGPAADEGEPRPNAV
jgi:hypothetical protein